VAVNVAPVLIIRYFYFLSMFLAKAQRKRKGAKLQTLGFHNIEESLRLCFTLRLCVEKIL